MNEWEWPQWMVVVLLVLFFLKQVEHDYKVARCGPERLGAHMASVVMTALWIIPLYFGRFWS